MAELGLPPDSVVVGRKAAKNALLQAMPDSKASALTQTELFQKAGILTKTTGQRALNELLAECKIERIGKGGPLDLYRYFASGARYLPRVGH